jgi:glyoxylase-like metal-dependent hydrolase (beta-lactamase superfamily II)
MSETAAARPAAPYLSALSVPRAGVGLEPGFYDEATGSVQYVVADQIRRRCAIIDPVLDFDPTSGATRTTSADRLLRHIEARGLTLEWILDTHPHADHFSAAGYLKDMTGAHRHRRAGDRGPENLEETLENNSRLARSRRGRCYLLVTRCAPSPTS